MKKVARSMVLLLMSVLLVFTLTACSQNSVDQQADESAADANFKPFIVPNFNRQVSIEKIPQSVFVVSTTNAEILLALGLEDKIVGVAPDMSQQVAPEYQDIWNSLNVVGEEVTAAGGVFTGYPTFEEIVATNPDFIYANILTLGDSGKITALSNVEKTGIPIYLSSVYSMPNTKMDDVYTEILTLGRIFDVEKRAEELVGEMAAKVNSVSENLGEIEKPVPIFVYDSEDAGMIFTAGSAALSDFISLAGGNNIFSDASKAWLFANKEKIIDSKPEIIVIINYGEVSAEDKIASIKQNPLFSELPAVVNDKIIVVDISETLAGIRSADCVKKLATAFYPEKFE
ncbi:ABC transporter substrate-binding protein [Desulfitobacterium chlororespirans]|uniref:Iron complex transport system substrate-binding protein n=1 Tax=Desulfitobacterium chlororespirans DSM 11544 TaxID=1121395 RepID=A0A1M7SKE7_9FIRM|nr:ABC transporter substrate-binding protein [Desulfitobacterium chlororespirans]SHN58973.1 iron complex transport system substrate-binding protein [Desulfitobacterium chlororespirans DSM 11544]